jgi:hypothetical protein
VEEMGGKELISGRLVHAKGVDSDHLVDALTKHVKLQLHYHRGEPSMSACRFNTIFLEISPLEPNLYPHALFYQYRSVWIFIHHL